MSKKIEVWKQSGYKSDEEKKYFENFEELLELRAKVYARLKWTPSDLFVPDKLRNVQAKLLDKYKLKPPIGQTQLEHASRDLPMTGSGVLQPANHITNGQNLGKQIYMQAFNSDNLHKANLSKVQPKIVKSDVSRVDENCSEDDITDDSENSLGVSSSD